jgi:hypothetical protein
MNFLIVLCLGIVFLNVNALGITDVDTNATASVVLAKLTADEAVTKTLNAIPACAPVTASLRLCHAAAISTRVGCIGMNSPWMIKGIAIASGLGAIIGQSTSANDACDKISSTTDKLQKIGTAFNLACGGALAACDNTCGKLQLAIPKCMDAALVATKVGPGAVAGAADAAVALEDMQTTVIAQNKLCTIDYKMSLMSGFASLATLVAAKKSASGCQEATKAENNQNIVDCSDAKNKNNTTCICMRSPGAAGCGNANLFAGTPTVGGSGNSGTGDPSLTVPTGGDGGGDGAANPLAGLGHGSGSGGGGSSLAPGSGGGAGGGAGGSGSGTDGKEKTGGAKGLNTNILSGTDSGGGGGSRGSSGGGSYQAYLPGGAKDPNRNLASQTPASALAAQVSAAGSKSNWEKVNDRYREAKTSLVPGQ